MASRDRPMGRARVPGGGDVVTLEATSSLQVARCTVTFSPGAPSSPKAACMAAAKRERGRWCCGDETSEPVKDAHLTGHAADVAVDPSAWQRSCGQDGGGDGDGSSKQATYTSTGI
ncbi:hypothetical protein Vretimale_13747 [Volvox reticuliferus]|uniref:Uncharacterized protein n=2 Tax=Volvox reticuliferus TaxID=1737510 RepID=A0A8J4LUJ9_9CHLO|nr:hypothetical protein Vretimale_13747 [Volvox reticuliferus]